MAEAPRPSAETDCWLWRDDEDRNQRGDEERGETQIAAHILTEEGEWRMRSGWMRQPRGLQATDWFGGNYSAQRRADDLSTCSTLGGRRRHQQHLFSLSEPSSSSRFV